MTYQIEGNTLLFAIDRRQIVDIAVNDTIQVKGFPGASHVWTGHDMEFVENNPDDEIFLEVKRVGDNQYKAAGILLQ